MRKSYLLYIAFFAVMALLDAQVKPSAVAFGKQAGVQQAALWNGLPVFEEMHFQNGAGKDTLNWKILGQIKYVKKPHQDYPEGVMFPVVNPTLKTKGKKRIVMSGFIIPIDNTTYALSKNVFASCFFCGQAGPETIMGIKFKGATPRLKTDQYVTLEGVFRYNETDVEDWIYHIEDAVIVKGK